MIENKQKGKDSLGQNVESGDTIAYAVSISGAINYYTDTLIGFTETGRAKCKKSGAKKNFIKIFNQDK